MKKNSTKTIFTVLCFVVAAVLIGGAFIGSAATARRKKMEFDQLTAKISSYAQTTGDRVNDSIVTLPELTVTTPLHNGKGTFDSPSIGAGKGAVALSSAQLVTKLVTGSVGAADPRLDAVVPMFVTGDSTGTSMFIVLFNDRGDTALEKSYARLGREDVIIEKINILEPDPNTKEEYKVDIVYKKEGLDSKTKSFVSLPKETVIPVIDGKFDPAGTVNT